MKTILTVAAAAALAISLPSTAAAQSALAAGMRMMARREYFMGLLSFSRAENCRPSFG